MSAENQLQSSIASPVEQEQEPPTAPTAEEYKEVETQIAAKREQLTEAPIAQLAGLVAELEALEAKKSEGFDAAYEEAHVENDRMDAEKAAQEKAAQEQAARDAEKAKLEAKNAERVAKIDEQIAAERAQLNGASPEQLSEIVTRMQELEAQKTAPQEELEKDWQETGVAENSAVAPENAAQEKGIGDISAEELKGMWAKKDEKRREVANALLDSPEFQAIGSFEGSLTGKIYQMAANSTDPTEQSDLRYLAGSTGLYNSGLTGILASYAEAKATGTEKDEPMGKYVRKLMESGVITQEILNTAKQLISAFDRLKEEGELKSMDDERSELNTEFRKRGIGPDDRKMAA